MSSLVSGRLMASHGYSDCGNELFRTHPPDPLPPVRSRHQPCLDEFRLDHRVEHRRPCLVAETRRRKLIDRTAPLPTHVSDWCPWAIDLHFARGASQTEVAANLRQSRTQPPTNPPRDQGWLKPVRLPPASRLGSSICPQKVPFARWTGAGAVPSGV